MSRRYSEHIPEKCIRRPASSISLRSNDDYHQTRQQKNYHPELADNEAKGTNWVTLRELDHWAEVCQKIPLIAKDSPFVPLSFEEWLRHRIGWMEDSIRMMKRKIDLWYSSRQTRNISVRPVLANEPLHDSFSLVLAQESIWIPIERYPIGSVHAPWPTFSELRHEGDDRNKSGYSRFPPLPRAPGNKTVNWRGRPLLKQFAFDKVGHPGLRGYKNSGDYMTTIGYIEDSLLREIANSE